MRIATWNINSVRQRIEHLTGWLKDEKPDVVCLQEIKCLDEAFPRMEIEALGYQVETHGQKTFNGVALLSRHRMEDVRRGLPGDESDGQARYIEAVIAPAEGRIMRVASIYLPNGNPVGTDKYAYKLQWMERLHRHASDLLSYEEALLLCGDYNVIPEPRDARFPEQWTGDALFQPESRAAFRRLLALGFTEAVRACSDDADLYTFWDYQAGAWAKNNGIRIDHILMSAQASDRFSGARIDKAMRAQDKPSDHVPVIVQIH